MHPTTPKTNAQDVFFIKNRINIVRQYKLLIKTYAYKTPILIKLQNIHAPIFEAIMCCEAIAKQVTIVQTRFDPIFVFNYFKAYSF